MLKVLSDVSAYKLSELITALGPNARIVSLYGFSGHHWAWVEMPLPAQENKKPQKKELKNGNT